MASSVIGALRVNLGLDSAQFEKGSKRAQASTQGLAQQMRKIAAVGAAMGAAIGAAALAGAKDIDQTAKSARRLGSSIGGFEAVKLAAEEAGVPVSALTDNLQNIDRELAKGGKNTTAALDQLGLTAEGLSNLDADEKIALIADRVKDLGLSSGQATALLQSLGVRSREMVLLLQGGGDAIRQARTEVEDYGLALSGPVVASIEQANDRIGRLSLVARVFGQQMAIAVVPALGALAVAITDSLREGGALRAVIETVASATSGWVTVISGAVSGLASLADFIGGPVIAAVAALGAAFVILQRRMIMTGIGSLIVGAGVLVDFLVRLKDSTGSWGEALSALGDLAAGVWEGIKTSASSIVPSLGAIWESVKAGFFILLENLTARWRDFLGMFSGFVGAIPGAEGISGGLAAAAAKASSDVTGFMRAANDAEAAAISLRGEASALATQGFDKARAAARKLVDVVNAEGEASGAAADQARNLANSLGEVGDGAGGGAAKKAAKGLSDAEKALKGLETQSQQTADRFGDMVAGIVTGASSIGDVFKHLGQQLLSSGISGIGSSIFKSSGLGETFFGSIFAGAFDSGGNIPRGQFGLVGERGPELVRGPANVTSRLDTARMIGGGVSGGATLHITAPAGFSVQQEGKIAGIAVKVTQAGIQQFARDGLPVAVDRINKDPRRRG